MSGRKPEAAAKKKRVGSVKPTKAVKKKPVRRKGGVKKGSKKKNPPGITAATYNKIQDAYFEKQSVHHAAKAAGVTDKTAKIYIEGPARPDVGMVPIKQAWLDVVTEAQEKKQLTLLKFQQDQAKELEEIVSTNLAELKLIRAEVAARLKKYKDSAGTSIETGASMNSALLSYERSVKLMERMLGRPDLTHKAEGEDKYADWSDEQIIEMMETGKVPDHAR